MTTENDVRVLRPDDLEATEAAPGVVRRRVFETGDNVMVQTRVAGGVTTAWHHHADRATYGYLARGELVVEYGADGRDAVELEAGDCYYCAPGVVHRGRNPADDDAVLVGSFVGTGPLVVSADGPETG